MNVFAFFDPDSPHPLTRLWVKSWSARGWIPRLILPSEREAGCTDRVIANHRGGGLVTSLNAINFSRKPRTKSPTKGRYPAQLQRDVVLFPDDSTEDTVLHCGRPLNVG